MIGVIGCSSFIKSDDDIGMRSGNMFDNVSQFL
jgi:hypothetical protein